MTEIKIHAKISIFAGTKKAISLKKKYLKNRFISLLDHEVLMNRMNLI